MAKTQEATELAIAEPDGARAVTEYVEPTAGLSGLLGQEDIVLPVCSLTQPMSQGRGDEGHFWFPDGRSLKRLNFVVLNIVGTRALWEDIKEGTGGPLCKSADRVVGYTEYAEKVLGPPNQGPTYIPCKECRFYDTARTFAKIDGQWCPFTYTLLLYNTDEEEPFLFFVKGSAMKPVKQRIVSPAFMRFRRNGEAIPWLNQYSMEPRKVEQPGKKFWTPEITLGQEHTAEAQARFAALSAEYVGRAEQQTIEDTPAEASDDEEQATFA